MEKNEGKIIIFGCGNEGINAISFLEPGTVAYFTDNNNELWGHNIKRIPVISVEQALETGLDIYVSPVGEAGSCIRKQLENVISYKGSIQEYIAATYCKQDKRLSTLKGSFLDQRCFIIGTGPSLKVEDLNLLQAKGEVTFASNRIFKIFPKTDWRPDLYCVSDLKLLRHYYKEICTLDMRYQFIVDIGASAYCSEIDVKKLDSENKYLFRVLKDYEKLGEIQMPRFSENPARYVVDGGITVTYAMLQWAYYLGFSEVYLLGVDFDYVDNTGRDKINADHCIENYVDEGEEVNSPKLDESLKAYMVARNFAERHGFHIYNATRGGKLEVFERRNFDEIFEQR